MSALNITEMGPQEAHNNYYCLLPSPVPYEQVKALPHEMGGVKINETRRPLGWCGSNNMVAYVSKPKFTPFHASSLGNQNTNNDSQTANYSHSLSLPSPLRLQEWKGEKCSYPIPLPGCPFQIEFVLKNKLLKF